MHNLFTVVCYHLRTQSHHYTTTAAATLISSSHSSSPRIPRSNAKHAPRDPRGYQRETSRLTRFKLDYRDPQASDSSRKSLGTACAGAH